MGKRLRDYVREKAGIYTHFVYACQSTKRGVRARSHCENGKWTTKSMRSKSRANARYFHVINGRVCLPTQYSTVNSQNLQIVEDIKNYKWSSESENIKSNSDHMPMSGDKQTWTYQDYEKLTERNRVLRVKDRGMKGMQKASNSTKGEEGVISGKQGESYHK